MADGGIKRLIELGINATPALRELEKLGAETRNQTRAIDDMQKQIASLASGIKGVFVGLGIRDALATFISGVRGLINEMDALNNQAQTVGQTVEGLQELQHAFAMSGMHAEDAVPALARLSDKLVEVSDKTSNTGRILREMGITAQDTADTALAKLAEAFANAPDGVDKTALAIDLFGRQLGTKMVTLLNNGADGLQRLREEARELGIASDEAARQATEFNDNLNRLSASAKFLGISITSDLLPSLIDFTNELNKAIQSGTVWETLWKRFRQQQQDQTTIFKRWFGMDDGEKTNAEMTAFNKQWETLNKNMEETRGINERMNKPVALPSVVNPNKGHQAGKSPKEQASEWDKWVESIAKAGDVATLVPRKIAYLQEQIESLDTTTNAGRLRLEALKKALEGLTVQDAGDKAIKKLADEAERLRETPYVMQRIAGEIARLEAAGQSAGVQARVLREELLKMQAATDPVKQVTLELEEMGKTMARNQAMETAWFNALAEGTANSQQFAQGVSKYLTDTSDKLSETTGKTKDLAQSIGEAGAKFVTDFADKAIDALGRTDMAFGDMIESFLKQIAKLFLNTQFQQFIQGLSGTAFGGLLGQAGTGAATGKAWAGPGIEFMASGGILSSPTFFSHGGRLAVAGESGPEAVVPLQRGASGDLGVAASPVKVEVNNYTDAQVTTTSRDSQDGSRTIQLEIRRQVRAALSDGSMDRVLRSNYGMSRQPVVG